jgi:hypothetical protein
MLNVSKSTEQKNVYPLVMLCLIDDGVSTAISGGDGHIQSSARGAALSATTIMTQAVKNYVYRSLL